MGLQLTAERRKSKRYSVRLKVFDRETGEMLGYVEDLSVQGLRIMSQTPVSAGKEIPVWLDKTEEKEGIPLTLYRTWHCMSDEEPFYYYSGMHFISPTEESLDAIQELIHELFE